MPDFIADNFFIIVIVVGGLLSLLKNKSIPKDDEKSQEAGNPNVANSTRRDHSAASHRSNNSMDRTDTRSSSNTYTTVSVGDQQQKQMKELESRISTSSKAAAQDQNRKPHDAGLGHTLRSPKIVKPYHHDHFRKEIQGKLNQRGLIDSIVMAEVLGPPRAKKPYSSIISKKNK